MSQIRFYFCLSRFRTAPSWSYFSNQLQHSFIRQSRSSAASLAADSKRQLNGVRVEDVATARELVAHLSQEERYRLQSALLDASIERNRSTNDNTINVRMNREQTRQLFVVSTLPFIGFGFIDNFLMIVAAEYIEHSLGVLFAISTMAAAGLGHIVADVAGVGLTHYVEFLVSKTGVKRPVLTAEQLESPLARKTVNMGRLVGLVIGCLIGMFPLLFYDNPK
ncbi:Transmembrane protein 65 [Toxocara canis]|uniref:Transmembrane protein 65 n=1 Tax=Toxocara canis TaxID=6265 RepID=A0A0B2UPD7_TOXCA|nr:Transmembrane protein 65 [Toxocara canis]